MQTVNVGERRSECDLEKLRSNSVVSTPQQSPSVRADVPGQAYIDSLGWLVAIWAVAHRLASSHGEARSSRGVKMWKFDVSTAKTDRAIEGKRGGVAMREGQHFRVIFPAGGSAVKPHSRMRPLSSLNASCHKRGVQ